MKFKVFLLMAACLLPLSAMAQHSDDTPDDLLQHVPMATVFVLKACGEQSQSSWIETTALAVASYAVGTAVTYSGKQLFGECRPDGSDHRSSSSFTPAKKTAPSVPGRESSSGSAGGAMSMMNPVICHSMWLNICFASPAARIPRGT